MLPRSNRVARADDFRATVRRGQRVATPHALLYVTQRSASESTRFGFIVSKAVGNSVTRNLITRRLRAIGLEAVRSQPTGMDVVIRALPGSPAVPWTTLHDEILNGIGRSAGRS